MLLGSGCATHRKGQFIQFAAAGTSYADAIMELTEEAGDLAVDADSILLIKDMEALGPEGRRKAYTERTKELEGLMLSLATFRSHTSLLKKYFTVLGKLAASEAPAGIAESTGGLVEKLGELSSSLQDAKIGEAPVQDFLSKSTKLIVSHYEQKALEQELRKHAETIQAELNIQQAFLAALAEDVQSDMDTIHKAKSYVDVAKPYFVGGELPKDWQKNRRQLISSVVMKGSVANARAAAKSMQEKFEALTENKITPADFGDLFSDINAMFDLVELVQETTGQEE